MPPAVRIRPLPAMISVRRADHQVRVDAVHDVGVAGLAERDDPAVADADVGLDDAPVVEDDRAGDHEVGRALGRGSRAPGPSTRGSPCRRRTRPRRRPRTGPARPRSSRSVSASRIRSPAVGPYSAAYRARLDLAHRPLVQRPAARAAGPATRPRPPSAHERRPRARRPARSAPRCRRARRAGSPARGRPVEVAAPGWPAAKWKCEPTCTGRSPVLATTSVSARAPGVQRRPAPSPGRISPGNHGIGWCTVTSLRAVGERRLDLDLVEHLRHARPSRRRG